MNFDLYNNSLTRGWNYVLYELSDPRTIHLPWMASSIPGLTYLLVYWILVRHLGPYFMENREPFKLKKTLIAYNLLQVLFSSWLTFELVYYGFLKGSYSLKNINLNRSLAPDDVRATWGMYLYFVAKVSESFDTYFFVLKKNHRQISFLHLFHHIGMGGFSFLVAKYFIGSVMAFCFIVNTVVHIIMYSYYLLAALGPQWRKYLWWKQYLTSIQMIQFIILFLYGCLVMVWSESKFVIIFMAGSNFFLLSFLYLFYDFYKNNYKTVDINNDEVMQQPQLKKLE